MTPSRKWLGMLVAAVAMAIACGDDDDEGDAGGAGEIHHTFTEVHPILVAKCNQCHVPEGLADSVPFAQSDKNASHAVIQSQNLATPANQSAPLYQAASGQLSGHGAFAVAVTDAERVMILSWIESGAPNN
jgi:uncharacterized membrane protein